jgi:hypothetical protein
MPSGDVQMLLRFYSERERKRNNEIDLEEVNADQFAKAIGAV